MADYKKKQKKNVEGGFLNLLLSEYKRASYSLKFRFGWKVLNDFLEE